MHPIGLGSRRRVGSLAIIPDVEEIAIAGLDAFDEGRMVAARLRIERNSSPVPKQAKRDSLDERRPDAKSASPWRPRRSLRFPEVAKGSSSVLSFVDQERKAGSSGSVAKRRITLLKGMIILWSTTSRR